MIFEKIGMTSRSDRAADSSAAARAEHAFPGLVFQSRLSFHPAVRALACGGLLALTGCGSLDSSDKEEPRAELEDLRITEVHYHPLDEGDVPGDDFEFVEIKNTGESTLDLSGVGFSDGIEYRFPDGATLEPGAFKVIASVPGRFITRYGFSPDGAYTGQLSNSGETVTLANLAAGDPLDSVAYSDEGDWPPLADGGGPSLVPASPDGGVSGEVWRASTRTHGSPGRDDVVSVVVNEVSTHTDAPERDAVELFNPASSAVDIGGWYLSDDPDQPEKFRIPEGTTVPAGGYVVFDEEDFNKDDDKPTSFSLSEHGEEIWLFASAEGCDAGYCHGCEFGEIENGVTFGRFVAADGREHFPAQREETLGSENAGPRLGPVVISELMYHPANDSDEYVEIVNTSSDSIPLFDAERPENTWKVEGFSFRFPADVVLAPGEVVLILAPEASEESFRAAHGLSDELRIFQASGGLSNATETVALMQPGEPYLDGDDTEATLPFILVDEVTYFDGGSWPTDADGEGSSLQRKRADAYGNDVGNWSAEAPTAGEVSF